jgi:WhiB family transcriptional regulator, redox-sensing transcriptional regulator
MADYSTPLFQHPAQANVPNWLHDAACRGMELSIFYRPDNERGASARRHDLRAKAICADCPVRRSCLEWALATPEPYGVWGGMTPDERRQLQTRHGS